MTIFPRYGVSTRPDPSTVPPPESGDRLTRAEFERRCEAISRPKKIELIDGVVHVGTPVRAKPHGEPHGAMSRWFAAYLGWTPGLEFMVDTSIRLDEDNLPRPDLLLRIPQRQGGRSRIDEDGFLRGPPELVAEIATSAASCDLHQKLHVYRRSGVREYVVWRVLDGEIDWFVLREGYYVALAPDADGWLRSEVFPGLWLDAPALLRGDLAAVSAAVELGCATEAHAAFVRRLG